MTASDHLRDVRDSAPGGRVIRENEYWQRSDLGRGRSTGREYYNNDIRADNRALPSVQDPAVRVATPGSAGRTLTKAGIAIALAGAAGWLWLILALLSSVGSGDIPDDAFGTRLGGIPLGSGGLIAIIIGVLLVVTGTWLAKAANRRDPYLR